ncbi:MAG: hypothetical protein KAT11_00230 [Phycisphaerae bacterium]|nr:hypothetical protein [Phycisphaerae bacterium]
MQREIHAENLGLFGALILCLVANTVLAGGNPVKTKPSQPKWSQAKQARVKVAKRQRRIIFNDDMYELNRKWANTADGLLKGRLKPLVGTQVDTISFSVIEADAPVYDSKVQPIYGDAHGGPPPYWPNITANIKALSKAGQCPIQIITDFAHGNGMESWAHVRMNDCHDSFVRGWLSTWKKQHPELLVDSRGVPRNKDRHPLGLYVSALDFSHQEVRDRKLEIIEEICQRYDIDGFELDYIRHPVLFSRTMRGLPVTAEEVQIMTSFHQRIRQITDEAGARRGRPILLAVRVPDTLELSMNIGLDVQTWLKKDLVDILIAGGGYAPFTLPVEEFVKVAHQYSVPVYPCINRQAPQQEQEVSGGTITEGIRAVAANWYRAGADGIYFWNLGTPFEYKTGYDLIRTRQRCYVCLDEVGDPKMLIGKDKLFCVDDWVLSYYTHISSRPPLPVTLQPGVSQRVPFVVGDDIEAAARSGLPAKLKLWIKFRGPARREALVFRLNGKLLTEGKFMGEHMLKYRLDASQIKTGKNIIEASLKSISASEVQLRSLKLEIEYKADK